MRNHAAKGGIFLSCVILLGICLAQIGQSTDNDNDVVQLVAQYDNAWTHKDAATIDRTLAPGYVYFTSKGGVKSRQDLLDMLFSSKYNLISSQRSEIKVYRVSDTAVVGSRWKGQGTYDGHEFHDDQRCSIVLARNAHSWQVLSEHCTPITGS